jgi:very-short-patch-repair endonuclease
MRSAPTAAEAKLWSALRARLCGWKFRRQHVVAGYIEDFFCAALWLAVEVDGSGHARQRDYDDRRDEALRALGVRLVRVHNADVFERLDAVVERVRLCCEALANEHDVRPPRERPRARLARGR